MTSKKDIKGGIAFFMLYPLAAGLISFSPFGLILLPAVFSFILIKVSNNAVRVLVTALTYVCSVVFTAFSVNVFFMPDMWRALTVGAVAVTLLYITALAYSLAVLRGKRFIPSAGIAAGAFLIGSMLVAAAMYFFYDRDVALTATQIIIRNFHKPLVLETARTTEIARILLTGADSKEALQQAVNGVYMAEPKAIVGIFSESLRGVIALVAPGIIASLAILEGLCVSWGTAIMCRIKAFNVPERLSVGWRSGEPDFVPPYKTFFPKRTISSLVVALLAAWIMQLFGVANSDVCVATALIVLWLVFTLIGIFSIDFMLKGFKLGKGVRTIIILLAVIPLLSQYLFLAGIMDSLFGFRKRAMSMRMRK